MIPVKHIYSLVLLKKISQFVILRLMIRAMNNGLKSAIKDNLAGYRGLLMQ